MEKIINTPHPPEASGDFSFNLSRNQKKDSVIQKGSYRKRTGHKKLNKSRTHPLMSLSNCTIPSNYVALIGMENDVTPCRTDYCGFPYYRSFKGSNSSYDCVLMKDASVSCTLLEPKSNQDYLTLSAIEGYFLKQIKTEYQDFSEMTKKISSYTKCKLQNLSKKYKKRKLDLVNNSKKRPMATEYIDKNGIVVLKLRWADIDETEKKESTVKNILSAFVNSWNILSSATDEAKMVSESTRGNCSCIYKKILRTNKAEITPEIDRRSLIFWRERKKDLSKKCITRKYCSYHSRKINSDFGTDKKMRPLIRYFN
ncbi:uncharacterized protein LOC117169591 [Belonocnema kinseyi]|uniref:uncharacterized protein LOC117169591 n=1 Tax=Belonocnema kinseyi TaxID=2817044 RepID=UPI00143D7FD9|nr:uncharacterized protein LOC117169591 [Belonocnema kinseyi]